MSCPPSANTGGILLSICQSLLPYFSKTKSFPAAAAKSLQSCPTLCNPIDGSPPGSRRPWDSPGKNTGVGCYFLLQCMEVISESEVAQSCPTLSDPIDLSLQGSSVHGILQARVLEWGAIAFSDCFPRTPKIRLVTPTFMCKVIHREQGREVI